MDKPFDDKKRYDRHHIVPKCRKVDGYGVHSTDNIVRLQRKTHEAIHDLFGVKVPHEKIKQILETDSKVINKKYVQQLYYILQSDDFYIDEVKPKKAY